MSYYAIGIGGTGAKCLESLIHLAAAGMMPDNRDLYVLFVDPDNANGSRTRASETLEKYMKCKNDSLTLGDSLLLKTNILPVGTDNSAHWNMFGDTSKNLKDFFRSGNLDVNVRHLFEVLYGQSERDADLSEGFHGHPSIGAAVMSQTVDFDEKGPWKFLQSKLEEDKKAKVFLAGSIFGGTGASGFPTIAKLIHKEFNEEKTKVPLGGVLVLPYFHFTQDNENESDDVEKTLRSNSNLFLMNTQAALKYYFQMRESEIFKAIYLLGNQSTVSVKNFSGGPQQQNAPHFIELYSALAAIHFFKNGSKGSKYLLTGRTNANELTWDDLPDNTVQTQLGQFVRFAFAFLQYYQPILTGIENGEIQGNQHAWYGKFFRTRKLLRGLRSKPVLKDVSNKNSNIATYCKDFLLWLANIQYNHGEDETINLINADAVAETDNADTEDELKIRDKFDPYNYTELIHSGSFSNDLNALQSRMSTGYGVAQNAEGLGRFLSALYHNCG